MGRRLDALLSSPMLLRVGAAMVDVRVPCVVHVLYCCFARFGSQFWASTLEMQCSQRHITHGAIEGVWTPAAATMDDDTPASPSVTTP